MTPTSIQSTALQPKVPKVVGASGVLRHMAQLDGLRALAVLMVCWQHWMPKPYTRGVGWGAYGVDLFFVLSGFLITGILLRCRDYIDAGSQGVLYTAKQFFVRRSVRIFPLYFVTLALATVLLSLDAGTKAALWTYTYNLYAGFRGALHGRVAHFWSLAVEEQFYLLWPWVILLVPPKQLLRVIVGTILVGPLARLILLSTGAPGEAVRTFTPACLDALGGGALLAVLVERHGLEAVAKHAATRWLLGVGVLLFAVGFALQFDRRSTGPVPAWMVMVVSGRAPLFCWIVLKAAHGFEGGVGRLLRSAPLAYLGRISYGLYVFHAFAFMAVGWGPIGGLQPLLRFFVLGAATVGVSHLSWRFFEAPINRLKDRFPYRATAGPAPRSRQAA